MKYISRFSKLALTLILVSGPAAAAPPDISDVLRQVPPPQQLQQKPAPTLPAFGEEKPLPPLKKRGGPKIKVEKLKIAGNDSLPSRELLALVKPGEGKRLTLEELEELALRVTKYYRSKGYFVARAYLPEQDVTSGVVTIRVIEGRYGNLILKNNSLVKDFALQGLLDGTLRQKVLSIRATERAVMIINDMPGARVTRADVMPGDKVGTSDLAVSVEAARRFTGYGMADNYGTVYTGRKRFMGGVSVNSPLGRADQFSASGMLTEGQYIRNYRLGYSVPLLSKGLRAEVAAAKTDYQLTGSFAALDAIGEAKTLELGLAYPFRKTQKSSLDGALKFEHRKLTDEIRSTATVIPKTADAATLSFQGSAEGLFPKLIGRTTASASATLGNLNIDDPVAKAIDAAGARTEGRYGRINASVGHSIPLRPRWTLSASVRAQQALYNKNLDGSEDMSISGHDGVKAYPLSELSTENAVLFNAELQHAFLSQGPLSVRLGLFTDIGRAAMENQVAGEAGPRILSDVGAGAYANYKKFFASLQTARRTTAEAVSETTPQMRVLLQAGASF